MIKFKIFILIQNLLNVVSHSCDLNNGFIWCDNLNSCIKPWTTPCRDLYLDCQDCLNKQSNGLNIACPTTCDIQVVSQPEITSIDLETKCKTIIPDCDSQYACPKILVCEDDNLPNYITYKLKLILNSNLNILNIYALFGDNIFNMLIPPAYQSPSTLFGTNIGGIPDSIIRILPESKI